MHKTGYVLISCHPGGVTPVTYVGMARDLSTLFHSFKPGMGGLDCVCTFVAGSRGKTQGIGKYYIYNIKNFKIYPRNPSSSLPGNKNILSFLIPWLTR